MEEEERVKIREKKWKRLGRGQNEEVRMTVRVRVVDKHVSNTGQKKKRGII